MAFRREYAEMGLGWTNLANWKRPPSGALDFLYIRSEI